MNIEQREVFYSVRIELEKLKMGGFIIPHVVFDVIDNLEKEYDRT